MMASGIRLPGDDLAAEMAESTVRMFYIIKGFNPQSDIPICMRIGIHSDSAVAGIIEKKIQL